MLFFNRVCKKQIQKSNGFWGKADFLAFVQNSDKSRLKRRESIELVFGWRLVCCQGVNQLTIKGDRKPDQKDKSALQQKLITSII